MRAVNPVAVLERNQLRGARGQRLSILENAGCGNQAFGTSEQGGHKTISTDVYRRWEKPNPGFKYRTLSISYLCTERTVCTDTIFCVNGVCVRTPRTRVWCRNHCPTNSVRKICLL